MTSNTLKNCRLCDAKGPHATFQAIEMMYNSRESFDYFECSECGTVQIVTDLEQDILAGHYPKNYYSFNASEHSALKKLAMTKRDIHLLDRTSLIGAIIAFFKPDSVMSLIGSLHLSKDSRILDVGCGSGALLDRLGRAGFKDLVGVDAFIEQNMVTKTGAKIEKAELKDIAGQFDLVMFHHSLEHMPDLRGTLNDARNKLRKGGLCIVRIPTVSSLAWSEYRESWFQLDAPRHLVLPSRRGMKIAAEGEAFKLIKTVDDSMGRQFEYSENYRAGIPLFGDQPHLTFTATQKKEFARKAKEANEANEGDQTAFVLQAA